MNDTLEHRRAVEALRAGVPSAALIRQLGSDQGKIVARFKRLISDLQGGAPDDAFKGFFIRGRFGSGKSHLLKYFEQFALAHGLACSTVSVSKEVSLADRHELFKAAVNNLRVPDRPHGGLREAALKLRFDSQEYATLIEYVHEQNNDVDPLFRVTLSLFEYTKSDETEDQIISFWSGGSVRIGDLRREAAAFKGVNLRGLRPRSAQGLAMERFRFASRLLRAAGYNGWLLLLDEVELIAKYSPKMRLQSYSAIGDLLALGRESIPGLATIIAIVPDLDGILAVQCRDPDDWHKYSVKWDLLIAPAKVGLEALGSKDLQITIESPSAERLRMVSEIAKELYARCYDVEVAEIEHEVTSLNMRTFLRTLVTQWDLRRLDATYEPDILSEQLSEDLSEDDDFGNFENCSEEGILT